MKEHQEGSAQTWKERLFSDHRMVASLYDQRAGYYDALVHILSGGWDWHYRRIAVKRLQLRPGYRVLDIGCGTGIDLPLLSKEIGPSGWVIGIDLSRGMLYRSKRRIIKNISMDISLIHGNALYLPFANNSFDAILCDYLLSTVPSERTLKEIFRVAKPGASMVFADDRLPSGWFASPLKAMGGFFRNGYFNPARAGIKFIRSHLSGVKITNHHAGLIFIISGILQHEDPIED